MENQTTKKCPFCAEEIDSRLEKCPFCAEYLNQSSGTATAPQAANPGQGSIQNQLGAMLGQSPIQINFSNMPGQYKSNAPLILGIIAAVLTLPAVLCTAICAGVASSGPTRGDMGLANSMGRALWVVVICALVCFVCSFLGKTKNSAIYGTVQIISALILTLVSLISFNLFSLAGAVCYLIGGIISCLNMKRL